MPLPAPPHHRDLEAPDGRRPTEPPAPVTGGAVLVYVQEVACPDCDLPFGWHLHLHLAAAPREVHRVRHAVQEALSLRGCPALVVDDSALLVSELHVQRGQARPRGRAGHGPCGQARRPGGRARHGDLTPCRR